MLLHLHNTNKPQNEVPISEMETEEDDVVFSGDFSVDWQAFVKGSGSNES